MEKPIICDQCNAELQAADISSCPNCRDSSLLKEPLADGLEKKFSWETSISLFTNPLVQKQMATAIFVSGLILALFLSFISAMDGDFRAIPTYLLASLVVSLGIWLLCMIVLMVFFGNRMRVRYTIEKEGILWEITDKRARIGTRLTIAVGILSGSLKSKGAGVIAASREKEFVHWEKISNVVYDTRRRMIILRNKLRAVMMVACLPDNYDQVVAITKKMIVTPEAGRAAPARSPRSLFLGRSVLVFLAALPVFLLPWPFELNPLVPMIMLCFALATVWLLPFFGWVVIAAALWIGARIVLAGLEVRHTGFATMPTYRVFEAMDTGEWVALAMAGIGLAYMIIFSWRVARGRITPALVKYGPNVDE